MDAERRRAAERGGRIAETVAVWLLRLKGYRIVARNWRSAVGEVDIIARRGDLLVAVEVKRRPDATGAAFAIVGRQQRRIAAAAELFRARQPDAATLSLRFDAIFVVPDRLPHHLLDAWRA